MSTADHLQMNGCGKAKNANCTKCGLHVSAKSETTIIGELQSELDVAPRCSILLWGTYIDLHSRNNASDVDHKS